MQRLKQIRAAIQAKILAQYPGLSADATEPYCRLICRRALSLAARDADALEANPELRHERDVLVATFADEMAALKAAMPEVIARIEAQARDDDSRVTPLAIRTMEAFLNGEGRSTPLSLEALRARVDAGSYLLSRWGGREEELPAYVYEQHRFMVWMLAMEFDAPGLLNAADPEHPEGKAEMCEELSAIEIAALKRLIKTSVRCAQGRAATEEQAMTRGMAVMDELQRQFVGNRLEHEEDIP